MKPKKSPAKSQGTLFSFFSKEPPTLAKKAGNKELSQEEHQATNKELNRPTIGSSRQENVECAVRNTAVVKPKENCSKHPSKKSEELVGKRVKVYWADDNEWYLGKVVDYSPVDDKHTVHYADGDKEKVVLANEKVRSS